MEDELLHLLGIARRAGKLALGTEATRDAVRRRRAVLLLFASDLSPHTVSDLSPQAERNGVPMRHLHATMDELGAALGKRAGVIAVNDRGFAKKLLALTAGNEEEFKL